MIIKTITSLIAIINTLYLFKGMKAFRHPEFSTQATLLASAITLYVANYVVIGIWMAVPALKGTPFRHARFDFGKQVDF